MLQVLTALKKNIPNVILDFIKFMDLAKKNRLILSAIDAFLKGKYFQKYFWKTIQGHTYMNNPVNKKNFKKKINHGIYNVEVDKKCK